jgi:hypothetical protein
MNNYKSTCTPEQIASLYAPDPQAEAFRASLRELRRANPRATMADVLSEHVSKRSGVSMRYVNGSLVRA